MRARLSIERLLGVDSISPVVCVHRIGPQLFAQLCRIDGNFLLLPAKLSGHEANGALCVVLKSNAGDETNLLVLGVLRPLRRWDLYISSVAALFELHNY